MKITDKQITRTCPETEVYNELLELDNKLILELGCGAAEHTRAIANEGDGRQIIAMEVDAIQHNNNLLVEDLNNVTFKLAGAEAIPAADDTFDVVFMFKSLHHVPVELMGQALIEIQRVLKPNGVAYISEPIFAGDFNELLRLFNNEEIVRKEAFLAIKHAVDTGIFALLNEIFFNTSLVFEDFTDFNNKILQVTHTEFNLTDSIHQKLQKLFINQLNGKFTVPIRVDLLQAIK